MVDPRTDTDKCIIAYVHIAPAEALLQSVTSVITNKDIFEFNALDFMSKA